MTPTRFSVLVVDDVPAICETVRTLLGRSSRRDILVETETSAVRAIALARSRDFDLVISDRMMPDGLGDDVLRAARDRNPRTVAVLMSGYAGETPPPDCADLYLSKPLSAPDFLLQLHEIYYGAPSQSTSAHRPSGRARATT